MRRPVKIGLLAIVLASLCAAGAVALWPSSREQSGYPFARRVAGEAGSPLWRLSPEQLDRVTADDIDRLDHLLARLDKAVEFARSKQSLLAITQPDKLDSDARAAVRDIWWNFVEPMIAIDELKDRYDGWYGIDYLQHRRLHARAYAITYGALCGQVEAGQALLSIVSGHKLAQTLFDEAMPELGLPSGTFSAVRSQVGRTRDYSFVPAGAEWYATWLRRELNDESPAAANPVGATKLDARVHAIVESRSARAIKAIAGLGAVRAAGNKADLLKGVAFKGWFPIQKKIAEWAGDTRVAPQGRRLIDDTALEGMRTTLRPGDVLLERRNWYLSNIGLPGFWPHAALYTGDQRAIRRAFDTDADVIARFGGVFSEQLAKRHPKAWQALGERDSAGHPHTVIEAISEGVVAASFEHSCGADYVAALRPRLDPVELAVAIDRALGWFGRPYDFNFDFVTDDAIVCSELVLKAYEPIAASDGKAAVRGLRVPWVKVAGRDAVPPTEFARLFASENGQATAQLQFVYFLEGREATRDAVVADAGELVKSVTRPKWDVAQP